MFCGTFYAKMFSRYDPISLGVAPTISPDVLESFATTRVKGQNDSAITSEFIRGHQPHGVARIRSIAEWLAQKSPGSNRSRDAVV